MWGAVLLTVLAGYLLGNLNGAVSMSRLLGKKDVREHGSGNAGLTNFLRMFGVEIARVHTDRLATVTAKPVKIPVFRDIEHDFPTLNVH